MARGLWLLIFLFLSGGHFFELQEAIEELQSENSELQGKVQNLTEALGELRLLIWNQSQGSGSSAEHHLREHTPCQQDARRQLAAAAHLVTSSSWLISVLSLMAMSSKVIG